MTLLQNLHRLRSKRTTTMKRPGRNTRPKLNSSLVLVTILTIYFLNLLFSTILTDRSLSSNRDVDPKATKWKEEEEKEVPKIIHFIVLGDGPLEHLLEMVKFNSKIAEEKEFNVRLWKDEDAEKLVESNEYKFPGLKQSWKYIKETEGAEKGARRADFIRTLVMWAHGGVYLDGDFIACSSLDFLVDTPGVVSFPFMAPQTHQVNGCVMSSPPHHRLFELALENFIDRGETIVSEDNLNAAGPHAMANITDEYFKEIGVKLDPIFFVGDKSMPFEAEPIEGVIDIDNGAKKSFWHATVADIRFRGIMRHKHLYHIGFRSWQGEEYKMKSKCLDNPNLIGPYLEKFCSQDLNRIGGPHFENCGSEEEFPERIVTQGSFGENFSWFSSLQLLDRVEKMYREIFK